MSEDAKKEKHEVKEKPQIEETSGDQMNQWVDKEMSELEKKTELDKKPALEKPELEKKATVENKHPLDQKFDKPAFDKKSATVNHTVSKEKPAFVENQVTENDPVLEKEPPIERKSMVEINPELEKKPTLELKPVVKKNSVENKPELDNKPALEKRPEIDKKLALENKPVLEKKPMLQKKTELEKQSLVEKNPSLEKMPEIDKKPAVENKPALEIKSELDNKPELDNKVALEKKPEIDKNLALMNKPAFEKKPELEKKSELEKKLSLEKVPAHEKKTRYSKKTKPERNSESDKKSGPEKKLEVSEEIIENTKEKVEVKLSTEKMNQKDQVKEVKFEDSKKKAEVQKTIENKEENNKDKLEVYEQKPEYEEQSDVSTGTLLANKEKREKIEKPIQNGGSTRRPHGLRHTFIRALQRIRRAICSLFRCRPEDRSSHGSINELVTICRPILPSPCQKRRFHPEVEQMPEKGRVTGRFMTVNRRRKRQLHHLAGDVALNDDFVLGHVKKYLTATIQWEFNAFALENVTEGKCLAVLCVHLFHSYGLMQHFNMDAERVWKLFSLIEEGYHSSNPYHNAIHAADVTQAMHCFLQENRIREHMEPIELMSSLLAAIAHDLDHPGVSQPFLIATNNYLARLYDNTSVLENHHWRTAVSCVLESRVLVNVMSDDVCDTLVRQVSSLILATDITRQQDYLSHFKNHLDSNTLDMTQAEHRHMVMQIALKCADISNPCRPWEISKKWSLKVCEEFFRQGDYERELNLPITALCDRYTNSIPTIQTGFLKFVVLPLMTEWHRFLGSDLSKQMMKHLDYNQKMWEKLMAEEIKQEAKAPPKTVPPPENKMKPVEEIEEEDESGSVSDSNERLLPLRRRSLTTKKCLKKQIRRFSVPLNLFDAYKKDKHDPKTQESTTNTEETKDKPKVDAKNMSLNLSEICEPGNSESDEIVQAGQLRPDCKITCMTSPELASRFHAIKQGIKHKIIRQLTFPPLEAPAPRSSPQSRSFFMSAESGMGRSEVSTLNKMVKDMSVIETTIFGIMEASKTEEAEANDEASEEKEFLRKFWLASGYARRRESAPIGSQLRDNLTAVKLTGIASDPQLQRRKSMPTDAMLLPHEPKEFQVSSVLPDLLRTLSGKDTLTRRRGSAPVPAVASELAGRRGSRRNHVSCKASFPEAYHFHRRSSLPVEAFRLTEVNDKCAATETPPESH